MTELVRPFAWANHRCFDPFPCFNIVLARCLRVLRFYHRDPSGKSALPLWHGAISIAKFNGHMFNPKVRIEIWGCHVWKEKCPSPPTGELQYIAIVVSYCGVILCQDMSPSMELWHPFCWFSLGPHYSRRHSRRFTNLSCNGVVTWWWQWETRIDDDINVIFLGWFLNPAKIKKKT